MEPTQEAIDEKIKESGNVLTRDQARAVLIAHGWEEESPAEFEPLNQIQSDKEQDAAPRRGPGRPSTKTAE
jgi:hypothetical protein